MYEKLEACPSCKHPKFSNHIICKDHSVSQESFALVKCNKCDLIFTNPRPDIAHIGKYYENADYISHTNKATTLINWIYKLVRQYTFRSKHHLLTQHHKQGKILDYGCGSGAFIAYLNSKGYQTEGFEPHEATRKEAVGLTGVSILHDLNQLQKNNYDLVTAWHVLEHVHDLRKTLNTLRKSLKDNGTLFIALPNHQSKDALHYQHNWAAYDVPRHLYHFDKNSFQHLAKSCKLKLINTIPMKFDSYYVSMLSEKHIYGKQNILKAIKQGYLSNKAAQHTSEYSSQIFVLKK